MRDKEHTHLVKDSYSELDFYKSYIKEYGSLRPYNISYNIYKGILSKYMKSEMDDIFKGGTYRMLLRLGAIMIIKKKISLNHLNPTIIDWPNTNKHGKIIYYLNEHTRGYSYRYFWNRKNMILKYLYLYRLRMTRANKRRLAKLIKAGYDYFEKI